eukprot:TRINITY_DN58715_c0_g1_i1.p1 TRINITY_DN58715_c0_g1~~TRINITY_DN58715_c0_g1_i1.p1  ORF type:complete len:957 (-),score=73.68 TRINITY_DN58715_c0_g1_i1:850-3477(-)
MEDDGPLSAKEKKEAEKGKQKVDGQEAKKADEKPSDADVIAMEDTVVDIDDDGEFPSQVNFNMEWVDGVLRTCGMENPVTLHVNQWVRIQLVGAQEEEYEYNVWETTKRMDFIVIDNDRADGECCMLKVDKVDEESQYIVSNCRPKFKPGRNYCNTYTIGPGLAIHVVKRLIDGLITHPLQYKYEFHSTQVGHTITDDNTISLETATLCDTQLWDSTMMSESRARAYYIRNKLNWFTDKEIGLWLQHVRHTIGTYGVVNVVQKRCGMEIPSTAWCKAYELLHHFSEVLLHPLPTGRSGSPTVYSLHLCEAPGGFITAINHYLKTKSQESVDFDWMGVTMNLKDEPAENGIHDEFGLMSETSTRWIVGTDDQRSGDITKIATIQYVWEQLGEENYINIITADGCIDVVQNATQWNEDMFRLVYAEVICALGCLSVGRSLILKVYSLTEHCNWICLVYLLHCLFENVHFTKPVSSKPCDAEKYLVCTGYKGIDQKVLTQKLLPLVEKPELTEKSLLPRSSIPIGFLTALSEKIEQLDRREIGAVERCLRHWRGRFPSTTVSESSVLRNIKSSIEQKFYCSGAHPPLKSYDIQPLAAEDRVSRNVDLSRKAEEKRKPKPNSAAIELMNSRFPNSWEDLNCDELKEPMAVGQKRGRGLVGANSGMHSDKPVDMDDHQTRDFRESYEFSTGPNYKWFGRDQNASGFQPQGNQQRHRTQPHLEVVRAGGRGNGRGSLRGRRRFDGYGRGGGSGGGGGGRNPYFGGNGGGGGGGGGYRSEPRRFDVDAEDDYAPEEYQPRTDRGRDDVDEGRSWTRGRGRHEWNEGSFSRNAPPHDYHTSTHTSGYYSRSESPPLDRGGPKRRRQHSRSPDPYNATRSWGPE